MSEEAKAVEPTADEKPESNIRAFGYDVSTRGLLAFILIAGMTYLTIKNPEQFAKAYESISIAVIGFYFGQATRK